MKAKKMRFMVSLLLAVFFSTPLIAYANTQVAPTGLKAVSMGTITAPSIALGWTPAPAGTVGYDIFRSTSQYGTYTHINPSTKITGTVYIDKSITPGVKYYYKVKSYHYHVLVPVRSSFSSVISASWDRVVSINITPSLTIPVGTEGKQIAFTVSPVSAVDKRVTWTSSNPLVASVSSTGSVKGLKPGTATITAKTVDGGKVSSCVITVVNLNDPVVFIKQTSNVTCTLASATMLLRREAILKLDKAWNTITEAAVKPIAWTSVGLAGSFTYRNMSVTYGRFNTTSSKKSQLISLLKNHPEGIVVYDFSRPHAVLLTDYDSLTDTFYAADPNPWAAYGRIKLSQVTTTGIGQDGKINELDKYWFVSN